MSEQHDYSRELGPFVDRPEAEAVNDLGQRLAEDRPLPSPGFRVELRSRLLERQRCGVGGWRPRHLWPTVGGFVASGSAALIAALFTAI